MRGLIFLASLLITLTVLAQPNLDHLMRQRMIRCDEVRLNCMTLIPQYYRTNKIDSVQMLLSYWKNKCGESEPQQRMEVLLSLKDRRFTEDMFGPETFNVITNYRNTFYSSTSYRPGPFFFDTYVPQLERENREHLRQTDEMYDLFTQNVATEIQRQYAEGTIESAICEFYKNNFESLFLALQDSSLPYGYLKKSYNTEVVKAKKTGDTHMAGFMGAWIPKDSLGIFGAHPMLGLTMGFHRPKFTIDGTLSFSILESKNWYVVYDKKGNRYDSDRFGGFIAALEPCYNFSKEDSRSHFLFLTGLGYESITPVRGKEDEQEAVTIGTFSTTFGLGYRYFFGDTREKYIGIQCRYHVLNFSTHGGTNLDGNALSLRLAFGGISHWRKDALERLYYKGK
jgi:hypothetical protein